MIIKIGEIRASQKQRVDFDFTVSKMEGLTLVVPAEIRGYAKVENEGFFVCGEYRSKLKTPCVRCFKGNIFRCFWRVSRILCRI